MLSVLCRAVQDIGFINGELKYVAIKFRSVMKKRLPFSIGRRVLKGAGVACQHAHRARNRSAGHASSVAGSAKRTAD